MLPSHLSRGVDRGKLNSVMSGKAERGAIRAVMSGNVERGAIRAVMSGKYESCTKTPLMIRQFTISNAVNVGANSEHRNYGDEVAATCRGLWAAVSSW